MSDPETQMQRETTKAKKDKQKVIGETFTEAQLCAMLEVVSQQGESEAFARLRHAYQFLPIQGFEQFCHLLKAKGLEMNPEHANGQHFLDYLKSHPSQMEYALILEKLIAQ